MRKKNEPRPKSMRIDDKLWGEFTKGCTAEGRYPRRVMEAFILMWRDMGQAERAKVMEAWAKWWEERT